MEKMTKKKQIGILAISMIIILAGVIAFFINGLHYDLAYSDSTRIDIYIGKRYQLDDIKQMVKEVLGDVTIKYQEIETFQDTIAITVKEVSEEQINSLKEKIKEKYELESVDNLVTTTQIPHLRGKDIVKPYIVPMIITTLLILGYVGVRFMKLGSVKTMGQLLLRFVLAEAVFLSILIIGRIPIGIMTMPIAILIYFLVTITTVIEAQNKLEQKQKEEEEKK